MSLINDYSSDEDDSYRNKIEISSDIDGSSTESDVSEDGSQMYVRSPNSRSNRESTILPVKKKPVRLIDSDDDDDDEDGLIIESNSTADSINNHSRLLIGESTVDKEENPTDSDSEEVINETPAQEQHSTDSGPEEINGTPASVRLIDSDDENDLIESTAESIHNRSTMLKENSNVYQRKSLTVNYSVNGTNLEDHPDSINLSAKMRNKRITEQFGYNSEDILNSTAINPGEENKIWRPSNNFSVIRKELKYVPPEPSVEIVSDNDSDIIEVSSGEESPQTPKKTPFKLLTAKSANRQQTLYPFITKTRAAVTPREKIASLQFPQSKPLVELQPTNQQVISSPKTLTSYADYDSQLRKVNSLEIDYARLQSMVENMNLEELPDRGKLVKERLKMTENRYKQEKQKLDRMALSVTIVDDLPQPNVAWEDIEAGANAVLPKTFGKKAMSTYNTQKAVTLDRLQQLHEALQTCPKEEDLEDDPKGIKVSLMPHQKRALAWILFREKEKPSGGILADDMGLGKTLTMLSLVVKSLQLEQSDNSDEENEYIGKHTKYNGGTLVVCPASLINQWSGEIDKRLKRGLISYYLYHGPSRETSAKKLAQYDVVITTYAIIGNEMDRAAPTFKIKWRRVVLDEAHTIRNHKTQTSVACCQLIARSRWALTGTPMHNKELDMYALLKFLRCSPFDDLVVWKRWVGDKSSGGLERLHTVISSLMLRRTKAELMEKGALQCMPEKKWELINVRLDDNEMRVYHKVMIFSQTLFAQFLHQRAEKNQDYVDQKFTEVAAQAPNEEYFKMRKKIMKLNKVKDVSQHEILVLLLRLRQICCHPSLISAMLDESREDIGEEDEKSDKLDLLDQLAKLNLEDDDEYKPTQSLGDPAKDISQDNKITLKQASKGHLHPSDPVFAKDRISSKIKVMLEVLRERVIAKNDKAIIVSQWSSYLKLVAMHLKNYKIKFDQLDGQVPVDKRMAMVDRINNPRDKLQVLLLSLTAGGVGLNLVGANHLFLLDLHWNPQLENQAQDRIYRVGQTKPVFVYKFMAIDTIEQRIKALQDKKLAIAEGLLTGTKQVIQSKLSLQDLRMIFGM